VGYLVTLAQRQDPNTPRLALNTYCRPFLMQQPGAGSQAPAGDIAPQESRAKAPAGGDLLGIWCPEPGYIRVMCFDPDTLGGFALEDVAGWFKQSTERVYAATEPLAELEISSRLAAGKHALEIPATFKQTDELLLLSSHPARGRDDAACAILVLRPPEGMVEVLPQRWFTANRYDIGQQWIARVARDPSSGRLIGEGLRIGAFELNQDGTDVERWLQ
jgi:hypothetical protein